MFPTGSTLIFLSCLWAFSCIGKEIGEGHGQQATLHLRNGEKLPVQLVSGAPSELLLKSPLFEEPFAFPISLIHGVEFPGNQQTPQSPFQINTSNRDVLYGDLLEAEEDTLIFSHAYLKRVLFKRDAVSAFYRKQARPSLMALVWKAGRFTSTVSGGRGLSTMNCLGARKPVQFPCWMTKASCLALPLFYRINSPLTLP